ncbi:MAG: glycosyltransferase, partial [Actinobacteria bacterium]|nr:glycosyltransferase [Actinomycetota bacterium]
MTSSRRVAMTVEQFWHRVPGGTAVATRGMALALSRIEGLDLVGVAAAHRSDPPDPWKLPIAVRHLPLPRPALYEAWHRLRRPRVEVATGPVDVIHATSIAIPPRSAPLVVTIHDLAWLHEPAHFTPRGISFFNRGLALALKDADLVMCPSTATLEDCAHNGFAREKLRLVPMGAAAPVATEGEVAQAKSRYGLPDRYILWTGTIEPRKNLTRLLEAYARLDGEASLVLAGPKGWNEDLDALVKDKKDKVKVIGFV